MFGSADYSNRSGGGHSQHAPSSHGRCQLAGRSAVVTGCGLLVGVWCSTGTLPPAIELQCNYNHLRAQTPVGSGSGSGGANVLVPTPAIAIAAGNGNDTHFSPMSAGLLAHEPQPMVSPVGWQRHDPRINRRYGTPAPRSIHIPQPEATTASINRRKCHALGPLTVTKIHNSLRFDLVTRHDKDGFRPKFP